MKLSARIVLLVVALSVVCHFQSCTAVSVKALSLDQLNSNSDPEKSSPNKVINDDDDDVAVPPQPSQPPQVVNSYQRSTTSGACKISLRNKPKNPQPVFLKPDSDEFYPFSATGVMVVNAGATLQMFCPSKFMSFQNELVTATCVSGTTFRVNGNTFSFDEFGCKSWPGFVAQKTGATCNGGIMIRVGFAISASRFATQMEICFDEDEEVTRYVHHKLMPGSNYYQNGIERLTFQTAGFFDNKKVDKLYAQSTQEQTINTELGGDGAQYFQSKKNIFLSRGHMAAKADFVYGTQQRATFLFINVAPQWQSFNAGNWQKVEDGLRAWVSKKKLNIECYTGVWGTTTLPNMRGVQTPLYLSYDQNHNGLIPVPKIYFRVAIEPSTGRGIVFIGVNNPHLTMEQIEQDYILCDDVSDQITYLDWKRTDLIAGYSYACEVSDFVQKVTHLPQLSAPGGLLI